MATSDIGTPDNLTWHKSSVSSASNCVETAYGADGQVHVRESKAPQGPVLTFTSDEWVAFVAGAKNGEFDL